MRLRNGLAHVADAIQMVVNACEQHRAGGRARGAYMEIGKASSRFGQLVQIGSLNFTAKSPHVTEAPIVGQHHNDIGSFGPCRRADENGKAGQNG